MDSLFAAITALAFLFMPTWSAPVTESANNACMDAQRSSLEFNRIARTVSLEAREVHRGLQVEADIKSSLLLMEAKDRCDPENLRKNSVPCILKIIDSLKSYNSELETIRRIENCSEFADRVTRASHNLYLDVQKCAQRKTMTREQDVIQSSIQPKPTEQTENWAGDSLCPYIMNRLYSFSILTARVFAQGDPANHQQGSSAVCVNAA